MIDNKLHWPTILFLHQKKGKKINDSNLLCSLFKNQNVTIHKSTELYIYDKELMIRETNSAYSNYVEYLLKGAPKDQEGFPLDYKEDKYCFGKITDKIKPGNIDFNQAIVIGDLGHDIPICLDYRNHLNAPSVVVLNDEFLWEMVSPNVEAFLEEIK